MKKRNDQDGKEFESINSMCRAHNINPKSYRSRIRVGATKKHALTHPCTKKAKDHLGNEYKSQNEMCRVYNIASRTFRDRIKIYGWSLEDALTKGNQNISSVSDHIGEVFSSEKEMCAKYNIKVATYRARRKRGWSIKKSLTEPPIKH